MTCKQEIPIIVDILEPDVATVLQSFDQIQIYRSTSGENGPYREITNINTRLKLEEAVTEYRYEDKNGLSDYWYKFRYYNSSTNVADTFSDAAPGEPHPALQLLTVEELQEIYLFGLDLTDDAGNPYPSSLYAHSIRAAVDWVEKRLDIPILRRRFENERYDYIKEDYTKYIWLKVDRYPVIGVEEVKLVLPGEQIVQVFDANWIHLQRFGGQIQMVPGTGTAGSILMGASGAWIPFIYGANKFIPSAFRVTYEAGFGRPSNPNAVSPRDPDLDEFPTAIKELVGKVASFGPLNIAGDLLGGAGIASVSLGIDGLSQSYNTTSSATNAGYGARLVQYNKEIKEWVPTLKRYYHGTGLIVV